jgi:hypothetical protein
MHVGMGDATIRRIVKAGFPGYKGRTVQVRVTEGPLDLRSYWDGGSRTTFAFVRLDTLKTAQMPPQSAFDAPIGGADAFKLVPGVVVVEHRISCGRDAGICINAHPADANHAALSAPKVDLTRAQRIVLVATRSYKSSYAGRKEYRFHEARQQTRITRAEWDTAKGACIASKLLNKRGAITDAGRNAVDGMWSLRELVEESA